MIKNLNKLSRVYLFLIINIIALAMPLATGEKYQNVFEIGPFILGLINSFIFWLFPTYIILLSRGKKRVFATAVSTLVVVSILAISFNCFRFFGEYYNITLLRFVVDNPISIYGYLASFLAGGVEIALFIIGILAIYFGIGLLFRKCEATFSWYKLTATLLVPIICYFTTTLSLHTMGKSKVLPITPTYYLTIYNFKKGSFAVKRLHSSERAKLVAPIGGDKLNIVVIVNESWGKRFHPYYDDVPRNDIYPFMTEWKRETIDLYPMMRGYSNATATDVSMPSIVSGVGPQKSAADLHRMPLLWDYAKKAGLYTMAISSQQSKWAGMRAFYLSPGPDFYADAGDMDSPIVNDLGVDDLYSAKVFDKELKNVPKDKDVFLFFNTNGLHQPFQDKSKYVDVPKFEKRRMQASFVVDQAVKSIVESMKRAGRYENTLFILSGDHGLANGLHNISRIYCFYEECINTPFVVKVPERWRYEKTDWVMALEENLNSNVSNIDFAPTLAHILGFEKSNQKLVGELEGSSIFRPVDRERHIVLTNTTETRTGRYLGFSIISGDKRYISSMNTEEYYDLVSNRNQIRNDISNIDPQFKLQFEETINKSENLKYFYKKHSGSRK